MSLIIYSNQEHSIVGGLATAVGESVLKGSSFRCRLLSFGAPDAFATVVGSQSYLQNLAGLNVDQIVEKVILVAESLD